MLGQGLTKEHVCDSNMSKHAVPVTNLANGQDVQLTEVVTASNVNWKEDRPRN